MSGGADADLRLAVTGAGGRMGREVIEAAVDREGVAVAVAVNRTETDPVAGVAVDAADRLGELLAAEAPDVLVDFTGPARRSRTPRPAPTRTCRS